MSRWSLLLAMLIGANTALANPHEIRLPLTHGRIAMTDLARCLPDQMRLSPELAHTLALDASIDVRSVSGWLAVQGLNTALGQGFRITVADDALIVLVDPDKLPQDWRATSRAIRQFTQVVTPEASARQQRHLGLFLPHPFEADQPLVIMVHGLDGDQDSCSAMCACLKKAGWQTAVFAYPSDQPIADSAAFFTEKMGSFRRIHPNTRLELITESMGALVARRYVEGSDYAGGVDHFIMIAPTNYGSRWACLGLLEKLHANYEQRREDPDWGPSWMITQGLDEAALDLKPDSKFLKDLNALPRRQGVRYTIISGDQPVRYRVEADLLRRSAGWLSGDIGQWWGIAQARQAMEKKAARLQSKTGDSDGPVALSQTRLPGVDDLVVLHADHLTLYQAVGSQAPAAWPTVRQRLEQ